MIINDLKVNHIAQGMGYDVHRPVISWKADSSLSRTARALRILEENTMLGAALSEPGFDLSQTLEKACRKDFIDMPICRDFEGLLDLLAEIR